MDDELQDNRNVFSQHGVFKFNTQSFQPFVERRNRLELSYMFTNVVEEYNKGNYIR